LLAALVVASALILLWLGLAGRRAAERDSELAECLDRLTATIKGRKESDARVVELERLAARLEAQANNLQRELTLLSKSVRGPTAEVADAPAASNLAVKASEPSIEPALSAHQENTAEVVLDPDLALERQFGSMKLEPQRREQVVQIFNTYWDEFVAIQRAGEPDSAEQRVQLWKDYCLEIRPLLTPEQAMQIACHEGVTIRPGNGRTSLLPREVFPEETGDAQVGTSPAGRPGEEP